MNFETGEITWQARSVSKGSIFYADGLLYCYGEKNEMALVAANPKEYIEKGRFEVPTGDQPTWAHPVVANGHMYLRDMQRLTCYNVKAKEVELLNPWKFSKACPQRLFYTRMQTAPATTRFPPFPIAFIDTVQ